MTQILLPLEASVHSDISDDNISFKILNQDNLQMTISEERIFKPFDSESQKRKPNGIVYPTRRIDLGNQQLNQQKHLAKSNGHLDANYKMMNDFNFSSSHGNLYKITKQKSPDDFTKNLDASLRKLQRDKKKPEQNHSKKPFITTVKKGVFLEPPEISPPVSKTSRTEEELFEENKYSRKQLYAYVSKPMVLSRSPPQHLHRSRCEAAAFAAGLPYNKDASAEDATNVHKQREKRDTSYDETKHNEKHAAKDKEPYLDQTTHKIEQEDLQKKETREKMARRRALARKKAKIQSNRAGQVTINGKSPEKSSGYTKLKAVEIQTENYLHASLVKPPIIDIDTQTGLELLDGLTPKGALRESHDEETQIIPGDLYDLEEEIQGALDILVGKTIESALIEILEEEELAALKEQQRQFFEIRAEEQREAGDLMERHLIAMMTTKNNAGASILLEKYLIQLIPSVIEQLRSTGVISEEEYLKNGSFLPWLIEEVTMELVDILSSGDVLLDMVRDIVNRKAEISKAMNISEEHEEQVRSEIEKLVDRE